MNECGEYIDCNNTNLSLQDLIRLLISTDAEGCPAVRVMEV